MRLRPKPLEILRRVADALNSELIDVETAHISGVSYVTIGEFGLEFIEDVASDAKVSVLTTTNPVSFDLDGTLDVNPQTVDKQRRVLESLKRMGASLTLSCTPYDFVRPRPRTIHAWGESSAVAYINTFHDAWSDKVPAPMTVISAITGLTVRTPMYTLGGRRPTVLVDASRIGVTDPYWSSVLGAYVGTRIAQGVPYVVGWRPDGEYSRRAFAAALATYSSIVFSPVERITPNWEVYRRIAEFADRVQIDWRELREFAEGSGGGDVVYLGCPHASVDYLLNVGNYALSKYRGRRARVPVFISTSRFVLRLLRDVVQQLGKVGVRVFADSCFVVSPYVRRYRTVATDSLKAGYYMSRLHGVRVVYCRTTDCIDYAFRARPS